MNYRRMSSAQAGHPAIARGRRHAMLTMIQKVYASREAREQAGVFTSHLLLNISFFLVMFIASKSLGAAEFASLSLANTWIMTLATIFSFGMDQTALKLSIERHSSSYIGINLVAKALFFIIAFGVFLVGTALYGPSANLVIVAAAAGVALWSATRVVEQYERHFTRLAWLNLSFAVTRIVVGGLAIASQDWVLIVLALHVIAQLPVHVTTFATAFRELRSTITLSSLRPMLTVSPLMFLSISLWGSLSLITQSVLHDRGDVLATSAFGIALLFMSPVDLVITTFRVYVLPQILLRDMKEIDVFGLGAGSFNVIVLVFAAVFMTVTIPMAGLIHWIYGAQFPLAGWFFLIYFGGAVVTISVGLLNLRVQRENLLRLAVMVNLGRAAATALLMLLPTISPIGVVIWSTVVMIIGEIVLWAVINRVERRQVRSA
jgi:hypothetical protein